MMQDFDDLLTLKEVSKMLRLSPPTLYKLLKEGKIPAVKIGTQWRFHRKEILEWLEGSRVRPGQTNE